MKVGRYIVTCWLIFIDKTILCIELTEIGNVHVKEDGLYQKLTHTIPFAGVILQYDIT